MNFYGLDSFKEKNNAQIQPSKSNNDEFVPATKISHSDIEKIEKRERAMEIGFTVATAAISIILGKSFADHGVEPYFNTVKVAALPVAAMVLATLKIRKQIRNMKKSMNEGNQNVPQEQEDRGIKL